MNKLLIVASSLILVGCSTKNESNIEKKINNETVIKKNYTKVAEVPAVLLVAENLKEVEDKSQFIISGKAMNEISEKNSISSDTLTDKKIMEEFKFPLYVSKVKVDAVSKGEIKVGEEIDIIFNANVYNQTLVTIEGMLEPPHKNLDYVYYLEKVTDKNTINRVKNELGISSENLYSICFYEAGLVNSDNKDKDNLEHLPFSEKEIASIVKENN